MSKTSPLKKFNTSSLGIFGINRKFDVHTGIDLYCDDGDEVFSIEDGQVLDVRPFTGKNADSDWWEDTEYIGIKSPSGYIVYGELTPLVKKGDYVKSGDLIGRVKRVLRKDKGNPLSMLHLELYSEYIKDPVVWSLKNNIPKFLKNPISLLDLPRFDHGSDQFIKAYNYIINRSKQLIQFNVDLIEIEETYYGLKAFWRFNEKRAISIFLYPHYRNQGIYLKEIKKEGLPVITVNDCNIVEYLIKNKIECIVFEEILESLEYKLISKFYQDKIAKRSGIYLMNHIDDGLKILEDYKASIDAKKAFCIHPMIQSDDDLKSNLDLIIDYGISPKVIALSIEYRSVANEYLSKRKINDINEIRLSSLNDVNVMLIADKIQNYKDFLKYQSSHKRSSELNEYFKNWLKKLEISEATFNHYLKILK